MEAHLNCDQYTPEQFRNNIKNNSNSLTILNVNVQSLRKNFDSLETFMFSVPKPFDVVCITESFLYDNEVHNFPINDYVFIGKQRQSKGGGVGAYVRSSAVAEVKESRALFAGSESLHLELKGGLFGCFGSGLHLTIIYRQPSADIGAFLSDLEQYISSSNFPHHVILGDINIDTLKSDPVSTSYLNILSCSHFINSIQIPTRYNSCLDHINVNFYDKFLTSGTITTSIADHLPTFIKIENLTNYFNITKSTNIRYMPRKM